MVRLYRNIVCQAMWKTPRQNGLKSHSPVETLSLLHKAVFAALCICVNQQNKEGIKTFGRDHPYTKKVGRFTPQVAL